MNNPSTCPHFPLCSGCESIPDASRPPIWEEILHFFQTAAPSLKLDLITQGFDQSRYKAKLAVRPGPKIGLFQKNSHRVISIPECKVHQTSINLAVRWVESAIHSSKISLYDEASSSGLLRYLQLFVQRETGLIQLTVVVNAPLPNPELEHFCEELLKTGPWHSIWLNFHPGTSNRVLGESWKLVFGEPFLWQTLHYTHVAFHPGAFSQSHLPLFEKMLETLEAWINPQETILELYAGAGAIALSLRAKAKQFYLVENNPWAHLSFQESLKQLSPEERQRFVYLNQPDKEALPLFETSSLILVDPPRKGLDAAVLQRLCDQSSSQLIYISCGFESFKRDCTRLLAAGWKIEKAQGYLLFPGTNHVEMVVHLVL
jgi:tRNA/tmRNA/rRNA uracil-C5-methylase (TrmA/RlmC/RlmD family)